MYTGLNWNNLQLIIVFDKENLKKLCVCVVCKQVLKIPVWTEPELGCEGNGRYRDASASKNAWNLLKMYT